MDPTKFVEFKLTRSESLTKDTKKLIYTIVPDADGKPKKIEPFAVASCVQLKTPQGDLLRPYTPTAQTDTSLEFIIKAYDAGQMSQFLVNQKLGDIILILGPIPKLVYKTNAYKNIGMVCGGTGITPMWQIITEVLNNPDDHTVITLLYGSRFEDDIILRRELEDLAKAHPDQFKLYLFLSRPSDSWQGPKGRIQKTTIVEYIGEAKPGTMVMVCGTDQMVEDLAGPKGPNYTQGPLKGILKELGYTEDSVYKF
eukprot:Blabericola_migrator_1__13493@NODE_97_length_14383_cov_97_669181_g87_i0_p9_GENE_NODE_97_length_14383_cov_97_669181_g87_i0NODE_97_length_14383_cov_97_669181_g87_i0_p9_ORF_typecomplete_len254_score41_56NAD_binding_1/PF00175_21/2_1e30FAD_binding_6/PF00970_24/1_6e12NAD_binding_6/PF08030_12/8_8e08FAD_binding_9/PF08021_11/0_6FAD_binding_9/PF08021_11/3_2e03FAD_binding_9/PF08021_11/3_2e03_NODE_97_length_14383_cov_97_669181_g87_i050205781